MNSLREMKPSLFCGKIHEAMYLGATHLVRYRHEVFYLRGTQAEAVLLQHLIDLDLFIGSMAARNILRIIC